MHFRTRGEPVVKPVPCSSRTRRAYSVPCAKARLSICPNRTPFRLSGPASPCALRHRLSAEYILSPRRLPFRRSIWSKSTESPLAINDTDECQSIARPAGRACASGFSRRRLPLVPARASTAHRHGPAPPADVHVLLHDRAQRAGRCGQQLSLHAGYPMRQFLWLVSAVVLWNPIFLVQPNFFR